MRELLGVLGTIAACRPRLLGRCNVRPRTASPAGIALHSRPCRVSRNPPTEHAARLPPLSLRPLSRRTTSPTRLPGPFPTSPSLWGWSSRCWPPRRWSCSRRRHRLGRCSVVCDHVLCCARARALEPNGTQLFLLLTDESGCIPREPMTNRPGRHGAFRSGAGRVLARSMTLH